MTSCSHAALFAVSCLLAGCTVLLGVDDDYRARHDAADSGTGGRQLATGGSVGSGGSTGGVGGGGGGTGNTGGSACAPDEKPCLLPNGTEACVKPQPIVGCSFGDCTPCPGAPNADPICNGDQCGLQCIPGYEPRNGSCQPIDSGIGGTGGGSGGSGGSGGTSASGGTSGSGGSGGTVSCSPVTCTNACIIPGSGRCCKQDNTCGCSFPFTSCG